MRRIFFFLGVWIMLWPAKLLASEGMVEVSPPFSNITIQSGEKTKKTLITFGNQTKELVSLRLRVVDFGALDESGGVAFLGVNKDNLEKKYSLASWINLSTDYLNIDPGKKLSVEVTVLDKESLAPGGHYGAVLATLEQPKGDVERKVSVVQSYGSLFYVVKTGGEKFDLKLNQLLTEKMMLKLNGKIQIRFQNLGNVHVVPRGLVVVQNSRGNEVARGIINAESAIILPETFRWLSFNLNQENKWIMPGKYKLVVNYRYEGKTDFDKKEIPFYYLGTEGLLILIFSLISFMVLIWRRKSI